MVLSFCNSVVLKLSHFNTKCSLSNIFIHKNIFELVQTFVLLHTLNYSKQYQHMKTAETIENIEHLYPSFLVRLLKAASLIKCKQLLKV